MEKVGAEVAASSKKERDRVRYLQLVIWRMFGYYGNMKHETSELACKEVGRFNGWVACVSSGKWVVLDHFYGWIVVHGWLSESILE